MSILIANGEITALLENLIIDFSKKLENINFVQKSTVATLIKN